MNVIGGARMKNKMKQKLSNFFFEDVEISEEHAPKNKHVLGIILLTSVISGLFCSVVIVAFMHNYDRFVVTERICVSAIEETGPYIGLGKMVRADSKRGQTAVVLEPIRNDSNTHLHIKCHVFNLPSEK